MAMNECSYCHKPKSQLNCGICHSLICKSCAVFLPEDQFSFLKIIPQDLSHTTYCNTCYDTSVAEPLAAYNQTLEKAKDIIVYYKKQSKETRFCKRLQDPVSVSQCDDHDEAILRLAFQAVQLGFNALIDLEIKSEKIRDGSYQTSVWSATAIPSYVDESKIIPDRSTWQNPN